MHTNHSNHSTVAALSIFPCSLSGKSMTDFNAQYPDIELTEYNVRVSAAGKGVRVTNFDALPAPSRHRIISLGLVRHIQGLVSAESANPVGLLEDCIVELSLGWGTLEKESTGRTRRTLVVDDETLQSRALLACVNLARKGKGNPAYTLSQWDKVWSELSQTDRTKKMANKVVSAEYERLYAINEANRAAADAVSASNDLDDLDL